MHSSPEFTTYLFNHATACDIEILTKTGALHIWNPAHGTDACEAADEHAFHHSYASTIETRKIRRKVALRRSSPAKVRRGNCEIRAKVRDIACHIKGDAIRLPLSGLQLPVLPLPIAFPLLLNPRTNPTG